MHKSGARHLRSGDRRGYAGPLLTVSQGLRGYGSLGALIAVVGLGCGGVELRDQTPPMAYAPPLNMQRFEANVTASGEVAVRDVLLHYASGTELMDPGEPGLWRTRVAINPCDEIVPYRYTVLYSDRDRPSEPPPFLRKEFPDVGSYTRTIRNIPDDCARLPTVGARAFSVTTTQDAVDVSPGDGVCRTEAGECSLRAAVMESNALAGLNLIELGKGIYTLALRGEEAEPDASIGDLDITDSVVIRQAGHCVLDMAALFVLPGPGERLEHEYEAKPDDEIAGLAATIDAGGVDRVFEVLSTHARTPEVHLECLQVRGGKVQSRVAPPTRVRGAGILNTGTLLLSRVVLAGNELWGAGNGVGIYNSGQLVVRHSAIFRNQNFDVPRSETEGPYPSATGGGLHNSETGRATFEQSLIAMNTARNASAIVNSGNPSQGASTPNGHVTLTNTTVAGNRVHTPTGLEASIYNAGHAAFYWSTIEAPNGMVLENKRTLILGNSVVHAARDSGPNLGEHSVWGACHGVNPYARARVVLPSPEPPPRGATSLGGNFVPFEECLPSRGAPDTVLFDAVGTRLEYHGGFAPVLVPRAAPAGQPSPIDGSEGGVACPTQDQRGHARPARGTAGSDRARCDSGALELGALVRADFELPEGSDARPLPRGAEALPSHVP